MEISLLDFTQNFNFPIVNFPFLSCNIPSAPAYVFFTYHSSYVQLGPALGIRTLLNGRLLTTRLWIQA